jgi:hypothetical protein
MRRWQCGRPDRVAPLTGIGGEIGGDVADGHAVPRTRTGRRAGNTHRPTDIRQERSLNSPGHSPSFARKTSWASSCSGPATSRLAASPFVLDTSNGHVLQSQAARRCAGAALRWSFCSGARQNPAAKVIGLAPSRRRGTLVFEVTTRGAIWPRSCSTPSSPGARATPPTVHPAGPTPCRLQPSKPNLAP